MKEFLYVIVVAIIGIVIIESIALSQGIDGAMLSASFVAIGTIIGVSLDHYLKKYKLKLKYENNNNRGDH